MPVTPDEFILDTIHSVSDLMTQIIAVAGQATHIYAARFDRHAQHTSHLSGEQWVQELLHGHDIRIHNELGMNKAVFIQLLEVLRNDAGVLRTRHVSAEEQLAIFLHYAHRGLSNRALQERFQRSGDTVSKSIHRILDALTSSKIYHAYVKLPPNNSTPLDQILTSRNRSRYMPYFHQCLGALDGSHLPVHVPEANRTAYRNRKGDISQNVLIACTFDMRIVYVLSGWEGSASDSRIFEDARISDFQIPPERYYLGDAGYANSRAVMAPYQGKRYHLKEWGSTNKRPRDYQELFNYRHAQLRNVIERTFGVLKRRFKVLTAAQEYSLKDQARLVSALAVIHNFIRIHDPSDISLDEDEDEDFQQTDGQADQADQSGRLDQADERGYAADRRDQIARAMWRDYRNRD